jgi:hypothetical protein
MELYSFIISISCPLKQWIALPLLASAEGGGGKTVFKPLSLKLN